MKKVGRENILFFKYRSLEDMEDLKNIKDLLSDNKLVFSSPINFNDPFDSAFWVRNKGTKENWEEHLFWLNFDEKDVRYVLNNELKKSGENIYEFKKNRYLKPPKDPRLGKLHVLSLSQISDNIILWSHYASNHKGICLSFKADLEDETLGFYFDSEFLPLYKIKYQKKFPKPINLLEVDVKSWTESLTTKYIDWKYEKEWRLIFPKKDENNESVTFKQYKKDSLEGIIFGLYTQTDWIKQIYEIVKKHYLDEGYSVNFYKCKWTEGKYFIKHEKIQSIENFLDSENNMSR